MPLRIKRHTAERVFKTKIKDKGKDRKGYQKIANDFPGSRWFLHEWLKIYNFVFFLCCLCYTMFHSVHAVLHNVFQQTIRTGEENYIVKICPLPCATLCNLLFIQLFMSLSLLIRFHLKQQSIYNFVFFFAVFVTQCLKVFTQCYTMFFSKRSDGVKRTTLWKSVFNPVQLCVTYFSYCCIKK